MFLHMNMPWPAHMGAQQATPLQILNCIHTILQSNHFHVSVKINYKEIYVKPALFIVFITSDPPPEVQQDVSNRRICLGILCVKTQNISTNLQIDPPPKFGG